MSITELEAMRADRDRFHTIATEQQALLLRIFLQADLGIDEGAERQRLRAIRAIATTTPLPAKAS